MINKDGLKAGEPVDFDTLNKIKSKIRSEQNAGSEGREERKAEVHTSDQPKLKNTSISTGKKKA